MVKAAEVGVQCGIAGLDAGHPAVLGALGELFADLRSVPELKAAEHDAVQQEGKGALAELIVSVSSAGSIATFARILRLWMERDRHRSLTVSITEQESGRVVKIEGENISIDSLAEALNAAGRIAGAEPGDTPGADG